MLIDICVKITTKIEIEMKIAHLLCGGICHEFVDCVEQQCANVVKTGAQEKKQTHLLGNQELLVISCINWHSKTSAPWNADFNRWLSVQRLRNAMIVYST